MKTFLEEHENDFPKPVQLASFGKVPCHFIVDQGFRQTSRFIRPFSDAEAVGSSRAAHFNLIHCRARRVVENYFGILANRFRLLLRPIYAQPDNVKSITLSIMILHNLLIERIGAHGVVDRYGITEVSQGGSFGGTSGSVSNESKEIRERMVKYFCWRDGVRGKLAVLSPYGTHFLVLVTFALSTSCFCAGRYPREDVLVRRSRKSASCYVTLPDSLMAGSERYQLLTELFVL